MPVNFSIIKNIVQFIFLIAIFPGSALYGKTPVYFEVISIKPGKQDTLKEDQILYNGRLWRNLYSSVKGDQFFLSSEFLYGSVTINKKKFSNIRIRYDDYNDELITLSNLGNLLQLNKEMVDSFTLDFKGRTYHFANFQADSVKGLQGYLNVLVNGKSSLYVKYKKEIASLAVDNKYDMFFQTHKMYIVKDDVVYNISGKRDFLNMADDYKVQIRSYIKKNRLKVSKKDPETFVPLVRFYNSLMQ